MAPPPAARAGTHAQTPRHLSRVSTGCVFKALLRWRWPSGGDARLRLVVDMEIEHCSDCNIAFLRHAKPVADKLH
jgi:hypothetical protein